MGKWEIIRKQSPRIVEEKDIFERIRFILWANNKRMPLPRDKTRLLFGLCSAINLLYL